MRKLIFFLLLVIPLGLNAQHFLTDGYGHFMTSYAVVVKGGAGISTGGGGSPPSGGGESTLVHPITHDQYFVSHPHVANNDDIGYVHYLCTDSIFNNRTGDSYEWTIVSGNTNSAYKVNSSTGLIEVNNATYVTTDYTLGIEIDYGGDKDTASCYIEYRSGTEGTVLIYIDSDDAGGSPAGTFANPYQDLTDVDDFGEFDDGMTVLLKRGTEYTPNWWNIDNQGDKIVLGAYGNGAKPILNAGSIDYGQYEQMIKLGAYHAVGTGEDNVDDCDYCVIMDMHFLGTESDTREWYAIYHENFSDHNEYWRLDVETVGNGNSTFDCVGEWAAYLKVRDCGVIEPYTSEHWRAFKFEAGGGMDIENIWCTDMRGPGVMCGLWDTGESRNWGNIKYVYGSMPVAAIGNWAEGLIQVRDQGVTAEWIVGQNYGYGFSLENYCYGGSYGDQNPNDFTGKNGLFINPIDGIRFYDHQDAGESGDFDNGHFENVAVYYPTAKGFDLDVSGTDARVLDEEDFINYLIVDAGSYGIDIPDASEVADVRFYNGIIWNSTTLDIHTETTMSGAIMRNLIYDGVTSTSHWGTWGTENYDWGTDGDPFNSSSGGDFTTALGESAIIDEGYDVSQATDILGNVIGTQDISAFEYGGGNYNWTDLDGGTQDFFEIYKNIHFDELAPGRNTIARVQTFLSSDGSSSWENDSTKIINGDTIWSAFVDALYENGTQWTADCYFNGTNDDDDTMTNIYLTFYQRASDNWNDQDAGKLIGMSGKAHLDGDNSGTSGGYWCLLGEYPATMGFSSRGRWDSSHDIGTYLYHHSDWRQCWSSSESYGSPLMAFEHAPGIWYKVTYHWILNTMASEGTGNQDGILEIYRNDTCMYVNDDIMFRQYSDVFVDHYYFTVFGPASANRDEDQFMWYDDIMLWTDLKMTKRTVGDVINTPFIGSDNRLDN